MSFVSFRRAFFPTPTPEEEVKSLQKVREIYDNNCKERNCFACKHYRQGKHIWSDDYFRFTDYFHFCDLRVKDVDSIVENCDNFEKMDFEET